MKKVLSVAMASAMVLGMGANAFAIEYSTGSKDTAAWPSNFQFEGSLFVTNADGDIVTESITDLNGKKAVDFEPGDVIWMPLYADNQKVYTVEGEVTEGKDEVAASTVELTGVSAAANNGEVTIDSDGNVAPFSYTDELNKVVYWYGTKVEKTGYRSVELKNGDFNTYLNGRLASGTDLVENKVTRPSDVTVTFADNAFGLSSVANSTTNNINDIDTVTVAGVAYTHGQDSVTMNIVRETATKGTVTVSMPMSLAKGIKAVNDALTPAAGSNITITAENRLLVKCDVTNVADGTVTATNETDVKVGTQVETLTNVKTVKDGVTVRVKLPKVAAVDKKPGTIKDDLVYGTNVTNKVVSHGHYTGNIDKNWSINLLEETKGVAELIEKAELYKADARDYTSYEKHTDEIVPNGVYLKVTLKDEWKTTSTETLKYYVYVANNKSNTQKTNKVWVSGTYANTNVKDVDFTWSNNANTPALWKANDNGVAVFDFADKVFFTVKMYKGETLYLDLKTAYDNLVAGEMDVDPDSFYSFRNGGNQSFYREGELVIVTDDDTLVPYEIDEDGNFVELDSEYVTDYKIAHTNQKVNGFMFNTKQLGNYVLSTDVLGEEEEPVDEEPVDEEPVDEEPVDEEPVDEEPVETAKPNPETGAADYVGLAVSLAVVSVAAAGALALKK